MLVNGRLAELIYLTILVGIPVLLAFGIASTADHSFGPGQHDSERRLSGPASHAVPPDPAGSLAPPPT